MRMRRSICRSSGDDIGDPSTTAGPPLPAFCSECPYVTRDPAAAANHRQRCHRDRHGPSLTTTQLARIVPAPERIPDPLSQKRALEAAASGDISIAVARAIADAFGGAAIGTMAAGGTAASNAAPLAHHVCSGARGKQDDANQIFCIRLPLNTVMVACVAGDSHVDTLVRHYHVLATSVPNDRRGNEVTDVDASTSRLAHVAAMEHSSDRRRDFGRDVLRWLCRRFGATSTLSSSPPVVVGETASKWWRSDSPFFDWLSPSPREDPKTEQGITLVRCATVGLRPAQELLFDLPRHVSAPRLLNAFQLAQPSIVQRVSVTPTAMLAVKCVSSSAACRMAATDVTVEGHQLRNGSTSAAAGLTLLPENVEITVIFDLSVANALSNPTFSGLSAPLFSGDVARVLITRILMHQYEVRNPVLSHVAMPLLESWLHVPSGSEVSINPKWATPFILRVMLIYALVHTGKLIFVDWNGATARHDRGGGGPAAMHHGSSSSWRGGACDPSPPPPLPSAWSAVAVRLLWMASEFFITDVCHHHHGVGVTEEVEEEEEEDEWIQLMWPVRLRQSNHHRRGDHQREKSDELRRLWSFVREKITAATSLTAVQPSARVARPTMGHREDTAHTAVFPLCRLLITASALERGGTTRPRHAVMATNHHLRGREHVCLSATTNGLVSAALPGEDSVPSNVSPKDHSVGFVYVPQLISFWEPR